jgi:hypothetical protein
MPSPSKMERLQGKSVHKVRVEKGPSQLADETGGPFVDEDEPITLAARLRVRENLHRHRRAEQLASAHPQNPRPNSCVP